MSGKMSNREKIETLHGAIRELIDLTRSSGGVTGYHRNGDVAAWSELGWPDDLHVLIGKTEPDDAWVEAHVNHTLRTAPERPRYTCPDIDKIKSMLRDVYKDIETAEKTLSEAELGSPFYYTLRYMSEVDDMLEDLRRDNSKLRDRADHFQESLEEIQNKVEE